MFMAQWGKNTRALVKALEMALVRNRNDRWCLPQFLPHWDIVCLSSAISIMIGDLKITPKMHLSKNSLPLLDYLDPSLQVIWN